MSAVDRILAESKFYRSLYAQVAAKVRVLEEILYGQGRRSRYPAGPRDPKTRRLIIKCRSCGAEKVLHAHGLCPACYMRFYRRRHPKPTGSRPPRLRKVTSSIEGGQAVYIVVRAVAGPAPLTVKKDG
jgi:hypothetical protein